MMKHDKKKKADVEFDFFELREETISSIDEVFQGIGGNNNTWRFGGDNALMDTFIGLVSILADPRELRKEEDSAAVYNFTAAKPFILASSAFISPADNNLVTVLRDSKVDEIMRDHISEDGRTFDVHQLYEMMRDEKNHAKIRWSVLFKKLAKLEKFSNVNKDHVVQAARIFSELLFNPKDYEIDIREDVSAVYMNLHNDSGITSCMTESDKSLERLAFYDLNHRKIKIVVVNEKETGKSVARALLWSLNTEEGESVKYLDRCYVKDGREKISLYMKKWAKDQGFLYKEADNGSDEREHSLYGIFETTFYKMPYLDTLFYGSYSEIGGLVLATSSYLARELAGSDTHSEFQDANNEDDEDQGSCDVCGAIYHIDDLNSVALDERATDYASYCEDCSNENALGMDGELYSDEIVVRVSEYLEEEVVFKSKAFECPIDEKWYLKKNGVMSQYDNEMIYKGNAVEIILADGTKMYEKPQEAESIGAFEVFNKDPYYIREHGFNPGIGHGSYYRLCSDILEQHGIITEHWNKSKAIEGSRNPSGYNEIVEYHLMKGMSVLQAMDAALYETGGVTNSIMTTIEQNVQLLVTMFFIDIIDRYSEISKSNPLANEITESQRSWLNSDMDQSKRAFAKYHNATCHVETSNPNLNRIRGLFGMCLFEALKHGVNGLLYTSASIGYSVEHREKHFQVWLKGGIEAISDEFVLSVRYH